MTGIRSDVDPEMLSQMKHWVGRSLVRSNIDYRQDFCSVIQGALHASRQWKPCTAQDIKGLWREFLQNKRPARHFFKIYQHFPYCAKQCAFCNMVTNNNGQRDRKVIRTYIEDSLREARFFSPLFEGENIQTWVVGGGSPTFMEAEDLRYWLESTARLFSFSGNCLRMIELDPTITTMPKLTILKSLGFDYLSVGVQTFTADVLKSISRGHQSYATVRRFFQNARAVGFPLINADLLIGLKGETAKSFVETFRLLADLRPEAISIYSLNWTEGYSRVIGLGQREFYRAYEPIYAKMAECLPRLSAEFGYKPVFEFQRAPGLFFVAEETLRHSTMNFVDAMKTNTYLDGALSGLGLGWHSKSSISSRAMYQREPKMFTPNKVLYQLADVSVKEEMAEHIITRIAHNANLDYSELRDALGEDIRDLYSFELALLRAAGKIGENEKGVTFLPSEKGVTNSAEVNLWGAFFLLDFITRSHFSPGPLSGRPRDVGSLNSRGSPKT